MERSRTKYQYDGDNRRIVKLIPSSSWNRTDYYYNRSWQVLEERYGADVANKTTVAGDAKYQYVWDLRYIDAPLCRDEDKTSDGDCTDAATGVQGANNGDEHVFYCNDAQYKTTALVDEYDAAVLERYTYEPYGRVTVRHGVRDSAGTDTSEQQSQQRTGNTFANEILFSGYRYDPESGLYHVRNRMYHPTLERWNQRDPAEYLEGPNLYLYVNGNPASLTDPSGRWVHYDSNPHHWCANKSVDFLQDLAAYYRRPDSAWCLWPIEGTTDHGYMKGMVQLGDKYDASNLVPNKTPDTGVALYVTMDQNGEAGKEFMKVRGDKVQYKSGGSELYDLLKKTSGEGKTPISYYEIFAHGSADRNWTSKDGFGGAREESFFWPASYGRNLPQPSFQRAQAMQGPHQCWFSVNAKGYVIGCFGDMHGPLFAKSFLRWGAEHKTTPGRTYVLVGAGKWLMVTLANTVTADQRIMYENVLEMPGPRSRKDPIINVFSNTGWVSLDDLLKDVRWVSSSQDQPDADN